MGRVGRGAGARRDEGQRWQLECPGALGCAPQGPGSTACQDTQETKPRNDVKDPWKGFPFLGSLSRQMCAAAGRHSPANPHSQQGARGSEKHGHARALLAALATTPYPRMALQDKGPKARSLHPGRQPPGEHHHAEISTWISRAPALSRALPWGVPNALHKHGTPQSSHSPEHHSCSSWRGTAPPAQGSIPQCHPQALSWAQSV